MLARRIFLVAILAGVAAGAFVTIVQAIKIWPLIAAAEVYEKAGEAAPATEPGGHAGHDHGESQAATPWEPTDGIERILFTLLANILVAIGFGLLLSAGFALRDAYAGAPPAAMSGVGCIMAGVRPVPRACARRWGGSARPRAPPPPLSGGPAWGAPRAPRRF